MIPEMGRPAPPFELRNVDGEIVSLDDLKGHKSLVVFIPFPFTANCDGETCAIRDRLAELDSVDARVVIITTDTIPANREWSKQNGFPFPVLSDFWPHGVVTAAYGTFDDRAGAANRSTYVLDEQGIVRAVVATDSRRDVREFDAYIEALAAI